MKVLLVEDDPTTRALLHGLLRSRGHEVTACPDAETGWAAYQQASYPIVVLDWVLPGMDGLQLCRQMRALPDGDRSVIVLLTSRDQPQDLQDVLDAGADDYLAKPAGAARLNVRLAVAERQVRNIAQRKEAEAKVRDMVAQLQKSRDDMLSILNQLRIGSAMTDAEGHIVFLNETCQRLFGQDPEEVLGQRWEELLPFAAEVKDQIKTLLGQPPEQRSKITADIQGPGGRRYWVEVELKDDPRDPRRKIFVLYDMSEVYDLRRLLSEKARFQDLVGKSPPMLLIYQQIRDVAAVDSTVLIEGETGTGKELVARAIHFSSRRKDGPFVAVNSAGLTDSLLGSQLFGHKRGAFTGAIEDHKGVFEAANGGTLFLDEIGDVPLNMQTALLRVLQEREIVRLGESRPRKIDVRVLVATHHNLADDVTKGTFRSDLLYRIRVARIHLPALRARRQDIPLLVGAFLGECTAATGKRLERVSHEALAILLTYGWPGTVRELRSAIEFAAIRCKGPVIEAVDLPPEVLGTADQHATLSAAGEDPAQRVLAALEAAQGNRAVAARLLGISRGTLYRRLAELNIPTK